MPWKIDHKCYMAQPEPGEFSVLKTEVEGRKMTRIFCPKPDCRETFLIDGHEAFSETVDTRDVAGRSLPPGFVIVQGKRPI